MTQTAPASKKEPALAAQSESPFTYRGFFTNGCFSLAADEISHAPPRTFLKDRHVADCTSI